MGGWRWSLGSSMTGTPEKSLVALMFTDLDVALFIDPCPWVDRIDFDEYAAYGIKSASVGVPAVQGVNGLDPAQSRSR